MRNEGLQKTLIAGAAVTGRRIVKFGATALNAVVGAAATDKLIGVSDTLGADSGEAFDVILDGIAEVTYGGTVAFGDLLTSDSTGRAITSTTAGNRIIGIAMEDGVVGDTGSVLLRQHLI
jgi:hypothetical protein